MQEFVNTIAGILATVLALFSGYEDAEVVASIQASRTDCVSPCTVTFTAEGTKAGEVRESEVWRDLLYFWDFNTKIHDRFGKLYDQKYRYWGFDREPIESSISVGHKPMATKTFFCDIGICEYTVRLRAQSPYGKYDDTKSTITVRSESNQWPIKKTICVSNTLGRQENWFNFDKPCPPGAIKQSKLPNWDQYRDTLILLKRGDIFEQNIATQQGQSNWKLGYFGNQKDRKPYIAGQLFVGARAITIGSEDAPKSYPTSNYNSDVELYGWPSNITVEGIELHSISLPPSYQHIGFHNIVMDGRGKKGRIATISIARGNTYCHDFPTHETKALSCENVPYPKGFYLSSSFLFGSDDYRNTLNVSGIGCAMVNYIGMVDNFIARALEHNIRVMGWYRYHIHASHVAGGHSYKSKQKVSNRPCVTGPNWKTWNKWKPEKWDTDIEGRTRADGARGNGENNYNTGDNVKRSRWQLVSDTVMGDIKLHGDNPGGPIYQSNIASPHEPLVRDVLISDSIFVYASGENGSNINFPGDHMSCKNNLYTRPKNCFPKSKEFNNEIESDVMGDHSKILPPNT